MKLKVDRQNDALYFRLTDEAIFESEEVRPGVILDFDEAGRVVGRSLSPSRPMVWKRRLYS